MQPEQSKHLVAPGDMVNKIVAAGLGQAINIAPVPNARPEVKFTPSKIGSFFGTPMNRKQRRRAGKLLKRRQ